MTENKTILLIISGSIAAYKAADLCRLLKKSDCRVIPILTKGGKEFITPLTIAALAEEQCYDDLFSLTDEAKMGHIKLARLADAILVAPASANMIARLCYGMADDLASTVILTSHAPVFLAPAMNPSMFANPATTDNLARLAARGMNIIAPEYGQMACGEEGLGRMANVQNIHDIVLAADSPSHSATDQQQNLQGKKFIITAGSTSEPIDPVRIITNHSTGRQGVAIAQKLAQAGAQVTLLHGNIDGTLNIQHDNIKAILTPTADDMLRESLANLPADGFIAAAAVSDWKVKNYQDAKIKKTGSDDYQLTLTQNPDILQQIAQQYHPHRPKLVVGFAAETDNIADNAREKLQRKNCDMLLANQIGEDSGFGDVRNQIYFFSKDGGTINQTQWQAQSKTQIAEKLSQQIVTFFNQN